MKLKNIIKIKELFLLHVILVFLIGIIFYFGFNQSLTKYVMFDTTSIHFQDFLTILLTIFIALFGLVVTVCSVLIALGNNPFFKMLREFRQEEHFINKIKISLFTSSIIILLISIVFCGFDFSIQNIRFFLIYLIYIFTFIFYKHFREIIRILLTILYSEIRNQK